MTSPRTTRPGRPERPQTPPSPSSSVYTSRVVSAASSNASQGGYGGEGPHDGLTPDNIDSIFDALLDKLNSGYTHRQNLKQRLQEAEDELSIANWDLFLLDQQPHDDSATHRASSSTSPGPLSQRRSRVERRKLSRLTARDAALSRHRELWEEAKAATASVEEHMGIFWRLLRERARIRGEAALAQSQRGSDIDERARPLDGIDELLAELVPRGQDSSARGSGSRRQGTAPVSPSRILTPPPGLQGSRDWSRGVNIMSSPAIAHGVQTWI